MENSVYKIINTSIGFSQDKTEFLENQLLACDALDVGLWEWHFDQKCFYWSSAMFRIYDENPDLTQLSHDQLMAKIPAADQAVIEKAIEKTKATQKSYDITYRILVSDYVKQIRTTGHAKTNQDGEVVALYGATQDITRSEQEKQVLTEKVQKYQYTFESFPLSILTIDSDGFIQFCNNKFAKLFGYQKNELIGASVDVLVSKADQIEHKKRIKTHLKTGKSNMLGWTRVVSGVKKDGSSIELALNIEKFSLAHNVFFVGTVQTELHRELDPLTILKTIDSWVWLLNSEFKVEAVYNAEKTEGEFKADFLVGKGVSEVVDPKNRVQTESCIQQLEAGKTKAYTDYTIRFGDKTIKKRACYLAQPNGKYIVYSVPCNDAMLQREERDTFIREIHHRVKNNFQMINSLLSLHLEKEKTEGGKNAIAIARDRVFALSSIHELLYDSESLSKINLASYLQSLLSGLIYGAMKTKKNITIINTETVIVLPDIALKCGAIINELVTNTYKHGINVGKATSATIYLGKEVNDIVLWYVDDGPFYLNPEKNKMQASGLGTIIIQNFLKGLKAKTRYVEVKELWKFLDVEPVDEIPFLNSYYFEIKFPE